MYHFLLLDQIEFLRKKFSEYYLKENRVYAPQLSTREIGYIPFNGTMTRHISFKEPNIRQELYSFLMKNVPRHLYHSVATYEHPDERSMLQKKWKDAELIFDLDADHIEGADKLSYEEILKEVKKHTHRLINKFLIGYLNIDPDNIKLYFSGGRGYHVHVRDISVYDMNSDQRREVSNLVRGEGLNAKGFLETVSREHFIGKGWIGDIDERFVKYVGMIMDGENPIEDKNLINNFRKYFTSDESERKRERLRMLMTPGEEKYKRMEKSKLETELLQNVIEKVKRENACEIDEPVSTDIHRLIRFPYSLHGKTGFQVCEIKLEHLNSFNPLVESIPEIFMDGELRVNMNKKFNIEIMSRNWSLDGEMEVPTYLGMYLLLSGRAKLE